MRVKCNNKYYKLADSEISKSYQEFIKILPDLISPEPLPPIYYLRYHDIENFPRELCNQRTYKALLEEAKESQNGVILYVTTEEQEEEAKTANPMGSQNERLSKKRD